ncbi:hypothetical protein [Parahaliea mediterranea]|uniref:hypothetical protein n=1 Tax=Parahaliea mediterranea TaxID=651086 RepID=UPI000E2FAC5A|nr:hypothetical protein [Parahaliea mediterranea]
MALAALMGAAIAVNACTKVGPALDSSAERDANQAPEFTTPVAELRLADGRVTLFGIKACKVYQSVMSGQARQGWELLFKPAPYPLPQQCVRERLEFDGEYIQVEIGTQAMGAGGCCTHYAAYRSRDGEHWEVRPATSITQWQPLEAAGANSPE